MGGAQKKINLDRAALKRYLSDHKIQITKLSTDMGWANNYLSECLRDHNPKNLNLASYKYLCATLKVSEDTFIIKESVKPAKEVAESAKQVVPQTIQVQGGGLSDGQFNALLQAIGTLTDALNKNLTAIASAQQSNSVISGKIYGEVAAMANALGVTSNTTPGSTTTTGSPKTAVTVKPPYSHQFGEKKNA